jgi:hypothetical protein
MIRDFFDLVDMATLAEKRVNESVAADVQILKLTSTRIVCSKVYTSARSYPHGSVCKQKSIPI